MMNKKILLGTVVALATLVSCSDNAQEQASKELSFDKVLTSRRSIRSYDATKKITEAEVRELITAAQEAPSWTNSQPTKYYVAVSPEMLDSVKNHIGRNKQSVEGAPVLIVSTFERHKSGFRGEEPANEIGQFLFVFFT